MKKNIFRRSQPFLFLILLSFTYSSRSLSVSDPYAERPNNYRFAGFSEKEWGLGALVGDPIGARALYFTNWKRAFALSTGYSSSKTFQIMVDYLFYGYQAHDKVIDQDFWNSLAFYAGAGAITGFGAGANDPADSFQIGARVVGGIEYIFVTSPVSLRFEVAPEFFAKAKNTIGFAIDLGFTYYITNDDEAGGSGPTRVRDSMHQAPAEKEFSEFDEASPAPAAVKPKRPVRQVPKTNAKTKAPAGKAQPSSSELDEFK